jgi:hypothetical protein
MTTNRTPIARPSAVQITSRALDLYEAMGRLKCTCAPSPPDEYWKRKMCAGCERWYDLHDELNDELRCEPWEWPCVARQSPKRAGSTCMNEGIAARMAALKAAAKARRTASAALGGVKKTVPKNEPSREGGPNAEPAADRDTVN